MSVEADPQTLASVKDTLKSLYPSLACAPSNRDIYDDPEELNPATYVGQIVKTRIYTNKKGDQGTALAIKLSGVIDGFGLIQPNASLGTYEVFYNYSNENRFWALLDLYKGLCITVKDEKGNQAPISTADQVAEADPTACKVKVVVKLSRWEDDKGKKKAYISSVLPLPQGVENPQASEPRYSEPPF